MCGYSRPVPAEIITIASLKGGVGKTTSSYALAAAAASVGLARQVEVLDRIRGIVVTNAKRPMSRITESLLNGLTMSGLAFETVLWYAPGWVLATSGRGELPDGELLAQSKALLRE